MAGVVRRPATRDALLVALLFGALGWGVTFGTGLDLDRRSYGGPVQWDASVSMWRLWHLKEAVLGRTPLLHSDRVFYPIGLEMVRQEWMPVPGLLALPFQALGPMAAYNLQFVWAYLLTGLFTFLLCRHLTRDRLAALLGAVAFTFCEYHVLKAHWHGQPGQAHQEWIPLYLLLMLLFLERGRLRHALGAGLALWLAAFTSGYQLVFLGLLTLLWLPGRLALTAVRRHPLRGPARRAGLFVALSWGLALALASPVLLSSFSAFTEGLSTLPQEGFTAPTELTSYLTSSLQGPPRPDRLFHETDEVFLGRSVLALTALGLLLTLGRCLRAWSWLALGAVTFTISLGSVLWFHGKPVLTPPLYPLLQHLPVVQGARFVGRFSSLTSLALAVALALLWARVDRRLLRPRLGPWPGRLLKPALVLLVLAELVSGRVQWLARGLGYQPVPLPPAYRVLARAPGDFTLLTYPLSWESRDDRVGDVEFPSSMLMAYQPYHGKRLLTGFGDAVPERVLRHDLTLPFVGELARIPRGDAIPAPDAQAQALFRRTIRRLDIRYVLIQKTPVPPLPPRTYHPLRAERFMRHTVDLELVYEDRDTRLLKVHLPARPGRLVEGVDG